MKTEYSTIKKGDIVFCYVDGETYRYIEVFSHYLDGVIYTYCAVDDKNKTLYKTWNKCELCDL